MECLPSDVVLDILSRLPVVSVLDCKLVCKSFLDLISHPRNQFAKIHLQRQLLQRLTGILFSFEEKIDKSIRPRCRYKSLNYKPPRLCYGDEYNNEMNIYGNYSYNTLQNTSIRYSRQDLVVGSCNGLICLERHHQGNTNIYICNPITGEYVNLPPGDTFCEENYWHIFGFGYVFSTTNEHYKVVKISYPKSTDSLNGRIQVYTIGSGSGWRTIGVASHLYRTSLMGIFANGALYWINHDTKIMAFDLADEEFRLIQSPPCFKDDTSIYHDFHTLGVLRGNLCICHQRDNDHLLDIWSLEKTATGERWSRDFSIPYDASGGGMYGTFPQAKPILFTKENEVIFVHKDSTLYCYDPKADAVIQLWNADVVNREIQFLSAFPHMNSFVSLEALGERAERKKDPREREALKVH